MLEKTYHSKDVEQRLYEKWEAAGDFSADTKSSNQPYTIMMPPPNVTGSLHIGHALTFTLQDILIRYHRMRGRDSLWQPGTDHAGIATQMVVEKNLEEKGLNRRDLGREAFIKKVWEWKGESGGTITRQLRRLGASPDWARERFTMDEGLSRAVCKVFVELYKKGLIYRDKRLVNWDPKLHTAISDLEVQQREVTGKMWYFRYPVEGQKGTFITVGTTRPETLLGDTAIAVNPEDERYESLVGKSCILPLVGRHLPIIADAYADPKKGSGAVKITPGHDFSDFEVGLRHELDIVNVLDENGALNENAPDKYRGMDRFAAREAVIEDLERLDLLESIEENPMVIPYGDRSGSIIEPWLTDQWFADAKKLAIPAIKAVEDGTTHFVPKQWENTYFQWMRNIQPWCISRQLWWGHQIPAWYGPDGEVYVEETEEEAYAAAEKKYGTKVKLRRDLDVLDTWFSSALWPFSTLGWPEQTDELKRYYPTNVLVTGFDIIFFWVARMMMMGFQFMGEAPFREIYIHALVRDEKGQKMSKSKGNVMDPLDLCDRFGTDAVRFTLAAMAAQGRDIQMTEDRISGYRNFVTKIWNAARFCEINECRSNSSFQPEKVNSVLNRWIVSKTADAAAQVSNALQSYRFNDAAEAIYHFSWHTFCDWYLEFAKPVFQGEDRAQADETRLTSAWVLDQILQLAHPLMPFVTEELWQKLADDRAYSLIRASWPEYNELEAPDAEEEVDWVISIISAIRSVRSQMNVSPKVSLDVWLKDANAQSLANLESHRLLIQTNARLKSIKLAKDEVDVSGAAQVVVGEITLVMPLRGIVDLEKEMERLGKEVTRLDDEIANIDKKLLNEKFLSNAPAVVVDKQRARKAAAELVRTKVSEALGRISVP